MTNEEMKLTVDYFTEMQKGYIEGYGYEAHPLPQYFALEKGLEALAQLVTIKRILDEHDNDTMPEDFWYLDRIREVLK